MNISVVVPTYNERDNIKKLITELIKVFKKNLKHKFRIIVVDDNSPDQTADVVKSLSQKYKIVTLHSREKKEGLGAAYISGMNLAFGKYKADLTIVMDADLSHDPKYITDFIKKIENGADFVVGSRYISGGSIASEWEIHRKILSSVGNFTTSLFLGTNVINDWTSGYRAIKKEVYKKVVSQIEGKTRYKGYTFNIAFANFTFCEGFKISQIPINFIDRTSGKSKLGFEYLFYAPIFLFRTRLSKFLKV